MKIQRKRLEEEINRVRTEEFFLVMLNRNNIKRMPEFLDADVIFPFGKGKITCQKWLQMELDKIYLFRLRNGGFVNGKEFDPFFDEKGEIVDYYISTGPNAGERAIPIQDFAFPFVKDHEPSHALTLSIKKGLIYKIEVTYHFITYEKFMEQLKSN